MRIWVLSLFIASTLFVSVESAAESIDELSFHQTHHAHAGDGGGEWYPDSDDNNHESDACEHFCHAHVVAVTAQVSLPNIQTFQEFVSAPSVCSATRTMAPPTPPPNA